jgi:MinD superfamily P-loop ATPase
MLVCWSVKGGSGTTVVAAMLATALARSVPTTLIDSTGDQAAVFGIEPPAMGFRQWLDAGPQVQGDALSRLTVPIAVNLDLIGAGSSTDMRSARCRPIESADLKGSMVVVDAGTVGSSNDVTASIVAQSRTSLMVVRPCYLAAKRASINTIRVDGLIVIEEVGRSLSGRDIADVTGAPVVATLPWDSSIARVIDAGRLGKRLPRAAKDLERFAASVLATEPARSGSRRVA